uniref:Uncharacterized protein n=1 Tax=Rhizophora mucronata TaxID=61149 RepID=A0A2P2NVR0_RHIMU
MFLNTSNPYSILVGYKNFNLLN